MATQKPKTMLIMPIKSVLKSWLLVEKLCPHINLSLAVFLFTLENKGEFTPLLIHLMHIYLASVLLSWK